MSEHIIHQITLYLDDELQGEERRVFEAHVEICPGCRATLERECKLDEMIRHAYPLYPVPESLRTRVEQMLQPSQPRRLPRPSRVWMALAASVMVMLGLSLLWPLTRARHAALTPSSGFAMAAVEAHQRYTRDQLPLEVVSAAPQEVSAWFVGKLPFNLKLPNYPDTPGQSKPYEIIGARLLGFKQDYAAYVVYRLRNHPISLIVTSQTTAQPSGGEEIPWRGLRFHFEAINGWKVITWSDNGLTYALVSDFEERGQASCIVCHPGAQNQRVFKDL